MDSLVANYASSDEEEQEEQQHQRSSSSLSKPTFKPGLTLPPPNSSNSHSISLPPPTKTSSIFGSLPPPKSSSIFKSLPLPKTHQSKPEKPINFSQSDPLPKRVVQFKPPIDPSVLKIQEDHKEEKPKPPTKNLAVSTENSSSKSGLAALLPPPKNSFGVASSSSSAGRRSVVETDAPAVNRDQNEGNSGSGTDQEHEIVNSGSRVSSKESSGLVNVGAAHENYGNSIPGAYQEHGIVNSGNWVSSEESSGLVNVGASHENYESYGNYENYGSFENQQYWEETGEEGKVDGSFSSSSGIGGDQPESIDETVSRLIGKRGRNEIPANIIEVKQDQLINNRPREDQVKLTGIAFGPSYQPVSSVKGKPSKLHKRKHQIGSLYFDMKQKETELAERRSRGFLTKAETQAKYGW